MHPRDTLVVIALSVPLVAWCGDVHAGRPLVTDDAAPVSLNHLELELGVAGKRVVSGEKEYALPAVALTYGLYSQVEIGMSLRRVDLEGEANGFENLHLTTKYRILEETPVLPAFAFDLDIKLPTASKRKTLSTGKSDQSFRMTATKTFDAIAGHLNLGYVLVRSPPGEKLKNRIFGSVASEWSFRPDWTIVAEVFGGSRQARGDANELEFQTGLKYALSRQLVFDAAVGRSLRSSGTAVKGTLGLTWAFDVTKLFGR